MKPAVTTKKPSVTKARFPTKHKTKKNKTKKQRIELRERVKRKFLATNKQTKGRVSRGEAGESE